MKTQKLRVIVVDDAPSDARFLTKGLLENMPVKLTNTFADTLLTVERFPFDVALIDLNLASRRSTIGTQSKLRNGIDLARILYDTNPSAKIALYSRNVANSRARARLKKLGLPHLPIISKTNNGKKALSDFLTEALRASEQAKATEEAKNDLRGSILRLDTIDIALYRAIQMNPELLHTLDWRSFERLLANVLETLEYEIELGRGTKDGGIDIIAVKKSDEWGDQRYLLQAKRLKSRVGIEPVERLLFLKSHLGATKCCLATTSTFTRGAWALGRNYRWELELRDYNGLRQWIEKALQRKLGIGDTDLNTS